MRKQLICLLGCGWALVAGSAVSAQPPARSEAVTNPPVAVEWNKADWKAVRIEGWAARGPTSIARELLSLVQQARWDEAAMLVAGVDGQTKAVALLKRFAPAPEVWSLPLSMVDSHNVPEENSLLQERPPAIGAETEITVQIVTSDFLGVELRSPEAIRLRREKMSWPKGRVHEAGSAGVWRVVAPEWDSTLKPQPSPEALSMYALLLSNEDLALQYAGTRRSQTQAKQIGLGFMQFLQDCDEKFQLDEKNWPEKLRPYLPKENVFTAPGDPPGTVSYSLNPKLVGKSAADVNEAAETVLIYLGKDGKLDGRYDGLATVCYMDGHVKMVTPDTELRWQP